MAEFEDDEIYINKDILKPVDLEQLVKDAEIEQKNWQDKHRETVLSFPVTSSLRLSAFPFPRDKDGKVEIDTVKSDVIGEFIRQQVPMAKTPAKTLYFYKDGVYVPEGVEAVEELLYQLLKQGGMTQLWTPEYSNAVVKYVKVASPKLWDKPLEDRINVKNGIVRWSTNELVPHTPEYLSTVQLPILYNPLAECPRMDKFVSEVFPEDSPHLAWEILAWMITSSNRVQKMIILDGAGNNGKSTFLNAIKCVLGQKNISNVSLQNLEKEKFGPFSLYQKLANICGDIPNKKLEGTSVFKAITGGDPLDIQDKFEKSFSTTIFAKLLFSTNDLIKSPDTSEGFYRKIHIIPFHKVFTPDPAKAEELEEIMNDPIEISGMFNRALAVLPKVMKRGISTTESIKEANEEFRRSTDPIAEWIEENVSFEDKQRYTESIKLYDNYKSYCKQKRIGLISKQGFGRAFGKLTPISVNNLTVRLEGKTAKVWKGVTLQDDIDLDNIKVDE